MLKKYKIAFIAFLIISILSVWVYFIINHFWFFWKKQNPKPIDKSLYIYSQNVDEKAKTSSGELTKQDFYNTQVPASFKINDDLKEFSDFLNWTPTSDEDFNQIWEYFLYWKWENKEIIDLKSCLDWKLKSDSLSWFYKDICIWENKFIKSDEVNNFHIKFQLLNLPKAYNNKDFDCSNFIKMPFDYPDNKDIIWNNNLLNTREFDYFTCKFMKDKTYDLNKDYYFYKLATQLNKCEFLEDSNLIKLCEKWVENYWEYYLKEQN